MQVNAAVIKVVMALQKPFKAFYITSIVAVVDRNLEL
jgi:hypothetical protein